jgi:Ca-activated chloride channel family protein
MCQNIAKAGNGIYVRADNTNAAFSFIKKELEKMTTIEIESKTYSEYDEQYQSLAWIALFLLIVEFFILEKKNKLLKKIFTFTNKK